MDWLNMQMDETKEELDYLHISSGVEFDRWRERVFTMIEKIRKGQNKFLEKVAKLRHP